MRKNIPFLKLIFTVFLTLIFALKNDAQIAVTLFPSPAKQFFIDDIWRTTFINASPSSTNIYVQFVIRDNATNPVLTITTTPQNFTSGINHVTSTEGSTGKWAYGSSSQAMILQQTGKLPFGSYTFCATVFSATTNKAIGSDCQERTVEPMAPPQLSSPANKDEIDITNPVLVWIPPRPVSSDITVTYSLRLVELQSNQSPEEALLQNPPLLNQQGLTNLSLNYPADAPQLQAGKEYTWQVSASYEGFSLGTTDIWTFKVKAPEQKIDDNIIYPYASKKSDAKFYVSHGIFRFAYNNTANEQNLTYRLTYMTSKVEDLKGLPVVTLKPGPNKLNVDLRKNPGLKNNTYYTLEVKDSKGQVYKLLYYYSE